MGEQVNCIKLGKAAEGLDRAPWPGELGQRILANVSKEAWKQWMNHQTMLINEKKLSVINPEHKAYLAEQMENYFFGDGADQIQGYVPPSET